MSDKRIKLATSNPQLKDKISTRIIGDLDNVYWYIKFNIPLDESTVSVKSMSVTDTKGYIMRTKISYDDSRNTIIVSPLDTYIENVYYVLTISKKVKSSKGVPLKHEINILFKLMDDQISEFELLKSTVKSPKSVPRPKNYDEIMSKTYSFTNIAEKVGKDSLDYKDINVSIVLSMIGIALMISSFYFNILVLTALSVVVCLAGIVQTIRQITDKEVMSSIRYNIGVMRFNKGKYEKARHAFQKAVDIDPNNEEAEYAMNKVRFYLK